MKTIVVTCVGLIFGAAAAQAQPQSAAATPGAAPGATALTQTVEPSFRIEPVVLRFSARRGEVVPFEFLISSLGKAMDVTVEPVNLRQEETGLILHDQKHKPEQDLKLLTPNKFELTAGGQQKIAGELTVPIAKSNFLSYGILVREAGRAPDFESLGDTETKAGIRFVTQYVLRIDIETGVADFAAMKDLELAQGSLVERQGLPVAQVYLKNPTGYAFECHVNATLASDRKSPPTPLGMQTRASLEGAERYLVRVMPRSTLRLESPFGSPPVGEQILHISVSGDRREAVGADFTLEVSAEDFPGLAAQRAIVGDGALAIYPAQWELGVYKGAKRTLGVRLMNLTDRPQQVAMSPTTFEGEPLPGVRISPVQATLRPGEGKSFRVMLVGDQGKDSKCGVVQVTLAADEVETHEIPLAVLTAPPGAAELEVGNVELITHHQNPAFAVRLSNLSNDNYTPISAALLVERVGGEVMQLAAGYGVWLRPASSQELMFCPGKPLPAGEYQLKLQIQTHATSAPIVKEFEISLAPTETTPPPEPDAKQTAARGKR